MCLSQNVVHSVPAVRCVCLIACVVLIGSVALLATTGTCTEIHSMGTTTATTSTAGHGDRNATNGPNTISCSEYLAYGLEVSPHHSSYLTSELSQPRVSKVPQHRISWLQELFPSRSGTRCGERFANIRAAFLRANFSSREECASELVRLTSNSTFQRDFSLPSIVLLASAARNFTNAVMEDVHMEILKETIGNETLQRWYVSPPPPPSRGKWSVEIYTVYAADVLSKTWSLSGLLRNATLCRRCFSNMSCMSSPESMCQAVGLSSDCLSQSSLWNTLQILAQYHARLEMVETHNCLSTALGTFSSSLLAHHTNRTSDDESAESPSWLKADVAAALCSAGTASGSSGSVSAGASRRQTTQPPAAVPLCSCTCQRLCTLTSSVCAFVPDACSPTADNGTGVPALWHVRSLLTHACAGNCSASPVTHPDSSVEQMSAQQKCINSSLGHGLDSLEKCRSDVQVIATAFTLSSCPHPLVPTAHREFEWEPYAKYIAELTTSTCTLLSVHGIGVCCNTSNSSAPMRCALPCTPILYEERHWQPYRTAIAVLGTVVFLMTWTAVVIFFLNQRKVRTMARRAIVCMNVGLGIYYFDYLIAASGSARQAVNAGCTDAGALRMSGIAGEVSACAFDAFRSMFSLVFVSLQGPLLGYSWYSTISHLSNRKHSASDARSRKTFRIYLVCSILLAMVSALAGTATHNFNALPLLGTCRFSPEAWLYALVVPYIICAAITIPFLVAGMPKLQKLRAASAKVQRLRKRPVTLAMRTAPALDGQTHCDSPIPSSGSPATLGQLHELPSVSSPPAISSPTVVQRTNGLPAKPAHKPTAFERMSSVVSRRLHREMSGTSSYLARGAASSGLRRLLCLLVVYIIMVLIQSVIILVVHLINFLSTASSQLDQQLLAHIVCTMLSSDGVSDISSKLCVAMPRKSIASQIMLHVFTIVIGIVFTTWAFEKSYWPWKLFRTPGSSTDSQYADSKGSFSSRTSRSVFTTKLSRIGNRLSVIRQTSGTSLHRPPHPTSPSKNGTTHRPTPPVYNQCTAAACIDSPHTPAKATVIQADSV
eukprot:scpid18656/ scgid15535/ 